MHFSLNLECSNAAFGETERERNAEIARILRALADRLCNSSIDPGSLSDANGNTVGNWNMDQPEEESR